MKRVVKIEISVVLEADEEHWGQHIEDTMEDFEYILGDEGFIIEQVEEKE